MIPRHLPLISIPPHTQVFQRGDVVSKAKPILRFGEGGLDWAFGEGQGMVVLGDGDGRRRFVETILGKHNITPHLPPPGPFPFSFHQRQHSTRPAGFRHLMFSRPSPDGAFTDYTARYASLQEEDSVTLMQTLRESAPGETDSTILEMAKQLGVERLLDVPLIGLSSGQTRRARITAGLLSRSPGLILTDPFAGLDPGSRAKIARLLGEVEERGEMKPLVVLRGEGELGLLDWVRRVVEVREGVVWTGTKEEFGQRREREGAKAKVGGKGKGRGTYGVGRRTTREGNELVKMQAVDISYGPKKVLQNVSWSIFPGDKIHLQGPNGSGKTTILSLLLGHHPRSYSLPPQNLSLFGRPRREIPTVRLRRMIGHTSPEIFAAFPRNMGLSVGEAIGSGFEGVFSRRSFTREQQTRIKEVLEPFEPILEVPSATPGRQPGKRSDSNRERTKLDRIYDSDFSHFPANQQAIFLFLRAIVSRPRLLVLDEFSQTIDERAWEVSRDLLHREWTAMREQGEGEGEGEGEGQEQAVVVVSHYESEVPWEDGKVFRLNDGKVEFESS